MPRGAVSGKQGAGAKKAPRAHKLATEFPQGTVLTDLFKKEWQLGGVIGEGGFGLIYLAGKKEYGPVNKDSAEYVVKIEPKGNGPLYCEMHFYQRAAKESDIAEFVKRNKLQYLPVPPYIAFGVHTYQAKDYRFLVMPRFGTDLQHLLVDQGGTFSASFAFSTGLRMIDALQYMHEKNYYHGDIKAANILLGYRKGKLVPNEVYLVDYGLANLFKISGDHKEYKEDPRKAHDGTIEFTSRDAHKGVAPSRRADFEILGYCMLQWLYGSLPWMSLLKDPNAVAASKEEHMQDIPKLIRTCLTLKNNENSAFSDIIRKFLEEVNKLKYDAEPNYQQFKTILRQGLAKSGCKNEWQVNFATSKAKAGSKRKSAGEDANSPAKKRPTTSGPLKRKPAASKSPVKKTSVTSPSKGRKGLSSPKKPAKTKPPATAKPRKQAGSTLTSPKQTGSRKPHVNGSISPALSPSPSRHGVSTAGAKGKKYFPMPLPTKTTPKATSKSPAANPTRRKVKRVKTAQSDAAIQTSPYPR